MAVETTHCMKDYSINVVRQLVMGNFTPSLLKKINQKTVLLSIAAYSSLSVDQIQQLEDNLDSANFGQHRDLIKGRWTST